MTRAGLLASAASLGALVSPARVDSQAPSATNSAAGDWDLSWVERLAGATDKAVFDWPTLGEPADPMTMHIADRYVQNCEAVYAPGTFRAAVVLNIRTQAVPAALNDAMWSKFAIGVER